MNGAGLAARFNQGNDLLLVRVAFLVALRALGRVAVICFIGLHGLAFATKRTGLIVDRGLLSQVYKSEFTPVLVFIVRNLRSPPDRKAAKWLNEAATLFLILLYYIEAKKAAKMLTIASMEPMVPGERQDLEDLATDLVSKASGLAGRLHPVLRASSVISSDQ